MAEATRPYTLVVIGSSAGGIEVPSTLVGSLPAGFAAPIVIAQHLDPTCTSHLAGIIKVTEFFRDPELFDYLPEHQLPQLMADGRRRDNDLRLWSAGGATGEEAYSLAIALAEVLGNDLERFNVRIFATDLDANAVVFARRGIYPAAALANLAPNLVTRYFTVLNGEYEVRKRVRSITVFGQHDLSRRAPFPRIDLVLCRNVLIYDQVGPVETVLIVLTDVSDLVEGRRELEESLAREREAAGRHRQEAEALTASLQRLVETNRQLLEANQELATANTELRSANEEFQVSNEEAQAASEEAETLNEECRPPTRSWRPRWRS
jgi:hypothetical protein